MSPSSLLLLLLLPLLISSSSSSQQNDTDALIRFRRQTDAHGNLVANWTSGDACSGNWEGVKCNHGRVTSLSLPSLHLRGPIDSLATLDQLRLLDLHGNRLNGTLLPISQFCTNLKLLYLSSNDFSGEIPDQIGLLKRLLRLDLSDNNLGGPIPDAISNLTRLLTLRLQNNVLSGQLPQDLSPDLPNLTEFNVSNNELYGKVPDGLRKKFGEVAFVGNAGLCGSAPFPTCSFSSYSPPWGPAAQTVVPSNPSSIPGSTAVAVDDDGRKKSNREERGKGLSTGSVVAIVVGNAVVLLVIASFFVAYYCGRKRKEIGCNAKKKSSSGGSETASSSSSMETMKKKKMKKKGCYSSNVREEEEEERSKLVFFDRRKQFELEDLLRASAEMVGKGSLGSVYKAILEDGCVVAVKRLKDAANPLARKDFDKWMDIIGKLRHPNIVRLRAYYYAKEEKLLVYDYLPNGSLYYLLHGNRGPGRIPLDWTTRISLVLGAARGLARIHEEYRSSNVPHGNVKSSNVLVDKNGVTCISDFGLALLLNPVSTTSRLGGYRAPEQAESNRLSQMADVYGFGILLLEVLTGRAPAQYHPSRSHNDEEIDLPKWVQSVVKEEWTAEVFDAELLRYKNIEEELVAMLHLALACVAQQPDQRPTMSEVAKMIEDIRVEQSPLGEELDESRNSLSPSITTTEDALPIY